jgi:hypothetical protein
VNVEPPVGLHVAMPTQSSMFAVHALLTVHVRLPAHAVPVAIVPAGHVQLYEPTSSLQVPRPQRPGICVHSLTVVHVPPVGGAL